MPKTPTMTQSPTTSSFLKNLKMFNRKERFYLIGYALGNRRFKLNESFRRKIAKMFRLSAPIPENAFVAMDYHLVWIYASLCLASPLHLAKCMMSSRGPLFPWDDGLFKDNTQQDVDLLIAYKDDQKKLVLILLEAKGDTIFTNKQLHEKAERLKGIFPDGDPWWKSVVGSVYFGLLSPRDVSSSIIPSVFPSWALQDGKTLYSTVLKMGPKKKVTRCDADGKNCQTGEHWKIECR